METRESMKRLFSLTGLSVPANIEMLEGMSTGQEAVEPASQKHRLIGALHVCGQRPLQATPVAYVATPDIGFKEVYDPQTGEVLDPDLVRAGRAKER